MDDTGWNAATRAALDRGLASGNARLNEARERWANEPPTLPNKRATFSPWFVRAVLSGGT